MSGKSHSEQARQGADEFRVSLRLALLAWLMMTAQQLLLFLRPTPYGTPYVQLTYRYLPFAVVWGLWAAVLPALPFLVVWLARWDRPVDRNQGQWWHPMLLALLIAVTLFDHADHELMRFMGIHLSWSVVATYGNIAAWPEDMYALFAGDRGGPWVSLLTLPVVTLVMVWRGRHIMASGRARPWPATRRAALQVTAAALLLPAVAQTLSGGNLWRRAKPAVIGVVKESWRAARTRPAPDDLPALQRAYQADWLAGEADSTWRFIDSAYPLVRAPVETAAARPLPWNVVYVQLETFRGWDTGFLRPDRSLSPTPFLDSLAAAPTSSTWIRHLSFGPETVNGLFAGHCSIKPHLHYSPTAMQGGTAFLCLPQVLRRHGWRTALVTGIDPDWDFQTPWLHAWYDQVSLPGQVEEPDRKVFRRAAALARQLGQGNAPFLLTVMSYSNHVPFRSREPALDLVRSTRPDSAIWNTMHYTDDVLREFVQALRQQPWFSRTLLVVTGDHGANFGEHDGIAGQRSGWRETVWVPLVIAGGHPRLPRGTHSDVASLMDVAPTVTDLLGIRDTVPWMGHSLVRPVPPAREFCGARSGARFAERGAWSLVVDPVTGALHLYDALHDPLQRVDLAPTLPDTATALAQCIDRQQDLVDYLLTRDRVWPRHRRGQT